MQPETRAADVASAVVAKMKAVRDPAPRIAALVEWLHDNIDVDGARALAWIVDRCGARDPAATAVIHTLSAALSSDRVDYEARRDLYEAAIEIDRRDVARLLFDVPTHSDLTDKNGEAPPLKTPMGTELTLGERRALARLDRPDTLAVLLRDPDPVVIEHLLANPRITEKEVVKLAALRPQTPESLGVIGNHPRWAGRQAVKRAVVKNPSTPVPVTLRILPTLLDSELTSIARDRNLPMEVRLQARDLLRHRGREI